MCVCTKRQVYTKEIIVIKENIQKRIEFISLTQKDKQRDKQESIPEPPPLLTGEAHNAI